MARKSKALMLIALCASLLFAAGCGQAEPQHADLQAVYDEIAKLPDQPEMLPLSAKKLSSYYGIDADSCPQAIAAVCGDGLRVDEIWLFEAGSEEQAEQILAVAKSHVEQVCSETENYLPEQNAVAKQARALRIGNFAALFISPDAEAMETIFRQGFQG